MLVLKTQKTLRKNLRTKIKRTNIKKKLKDTLEYKEFLYEVKKIC